MKLEYLHLLLALSVVRKVFLYSVAGSSWYSGGWIVQGHRHRLPLCLARDHPRKPVEPPETRVCHLGLGNDPDKIQ
jgi:hypothetical protein